jgi:hypothetical protein
MVSPEFEKSLCSGLQSLQATLQAAKKEMLTDRRGAAITSLQGVTAFINSIPLFESQSLSLPLTAVMAELHDLNFGRVGVIVAPTKGFDNRKPDATFPKSAKAYAVFVIDALKGAGMTTDDAAKFVASELKQAKVPIRARPSTPPWKTVKNWRYDVTRRGPEDYERQTLEALRVEFHFAKDMPLDHLKREISRLFRETLPFVIESAAADRDSRNASQREEHA